MKKLLGNSLATTGLTLLLLAITATLYGARFLFLASVFQSFAVNLIIHLGFCLLKRLESNYFLIEISAEIIWVLAVVITAGIPFGWYESTPLPVLLLLGAAVYLVSLPIGILRLCSNAKTINEQLIRRREALSKTK